MYLKKSDANQSIQQSKVWKHFKFLLKPKLMIINETYIKSTKMFVPWLKTGDKSVNALRYFVINLGKFHIERFCKI